MNRSFRMNPSRMLVDENFRLMTLEEVGCYFTCLNFASQYDGIPYGPEELCSLARALGINSNKFKKLWNGRVGSMFEYIGGRFRPKPQAWLRD